MFRSINTGESSPDTTKAPKRAIKTSTFHFLSIILNAQPQEFISSFQISYKRIFHLLTSYPVLTSVLDMETFGRAHISSSLHSIKRTQANPKHT